MRVGDKVRIKSGKHVGEVGKVRATIKVTDWLGQLYERVIIILDESGDETPVAADEIEPLKD